MNMMAGPARTSCIVEGCQTRVGANGTYCDHHLPVARFVDNEQYAEARRLLRRGAGLGQAAARVGVTSRDLDAALWARIGAASQPEAMF